MNKTLMTALALTLLCGSSFAFGGKETRETHKCMELSEKHGADKSEKDHCRKLLKVAKEHREDQNDDDKKELALLKLKIDRNDGDIKKLAAAIEKLK